MAKQKQLFILCLTLAIISSIVFTFFLFKKNFDRPQLPVYGMIEPFSLTDENGKSFKFETLKGKILIVNFFFSTCGDICPIMSKNMASLNRSFIQLAEDVQLVSITVNPEHDSPAILKNYAKKYNADDRQWRFLTGEREQIRKIVVDNFKLGKIDEPIFHSAKFTLLDRTGQIRGYYEGTDTDELNKLFADAAYLMQKK